MSKIDWDAIKREYVTTNTSYTILSQKHGIPRSTIAKQGKVKGWADARKEYVDGLATKVAQEVEKDTIARALAIYRSADKLLDKVNQLLDLEDALSPRDLKSLSSTLMDLKMIHNIKDESEEQKHASEDVTVVRFVGNDWDEEDENA